MTYAAMAQDLLDTLDANNLQKVTLIGHSMGGKAVMALTALAPERISGLVVIDVAPVDYDVRRHDEIFAAINAVTEAVSPRVSRRLPSCVSILMKKACSVPAEVVC
jgi:esterase